MYVIGRYSMTEIRGCQEGKSRRYARIKNMSYFSEIPKFHEYFPSEEKMSLEQRGFYSFLEKEFAKQNYFDVQGQISYLFVYVYKILGRRRQIGYQDVYNELMDIAEAYHHEKNFFKLCKFWASDCLLANGEYDLFLEQTEPDIPIGREKLVSNLRLNIQKMCGLKANGIDLFKMVSGNVSKPTKKYLGLFKDMLIDAAEKHQIENGDWFESTAIEFSTIRTFRYHLFSSSTLIHRHKDLTLYLFDESKSLKEQIISLAKNTENSLRESVGLPKIGEGWVSETELFYFLQDNFLQTHVVQHGRPKWLAKQHFDIWFPRWKIAVEYHGKQHFEPVEFFGGSDSFEETKQRDIKKKRLAKANGVTLFVVTEEQSHEDVAKLINEHIKTLPQIEDENGK